MLGGMVRALSIAGVLISVAACRVEVVNSSTYYAPTPEYRDALIEALMKSEFEYQILDDGAIVYPAEKSELFESIRSEVRFLESGISLTVRDPQVAGSFGELLTENGIRYVVQDRDEGAIFRYALEDGELAGRLYASILARAEAAGDTEKGADR